MKLYTAQKTDLLEVKAIESTPDGLVIDGQIMGAMPMRALLTPAELRRGLRFLTPRVLMALVCMMFRR
jgi:hypothetical protein